MKIISLFLALCMCTFSFATTYYISPTGNDATGTGTLSNPWQTLNKATSTVTTAGDIIHINAGTYTETAQCNLAKGVSIEGDNVATTIIKSASTTQWSALLTLSSPQDTNGAQSISNLTLDGQYVSEANYKTWIAIWITGRSNVIIHDTKIINFYNRGVIYDGNDATDPHTDPGHHATGNKFYNNTILNSATQTANYGSGLLNIGGQLGMEIYNNTLVQDQRGLHLNGWPIKYWDEGWLRGVKIYNNILTKKAYDGTYPGEGGNWDFAIEFFNIQGIEIYGNTIQGSIDLNYNYKGAYPYSAWIHNNTLNHASLNPNFESGIILEFRTESILIENNNFNNVCSGVQFNTRGVANSGGNNPVLPAPAGGYSYLVDNVIRNNLFANLYQGNGIGTAGGILVISEGTDDPQINNMQIYNNTVIAKAGDAPFIGLDFSSMPNGNGDGLYIRNNIVNGFNGAWLQGSNGNTRITNATVTNNDAFGNGSNSPSWPAGNPTNYIYNSNLSVNPVFVSATNFNLQSTSPVIDKGVNVGIAFSGIAPDGGYAEYNLVLPVKLISFTATENNGKNLLQWTTATESNSDHFSIERSSNGINYETIGRVNAVGFSSIDVNYNFIDVNPLKGINYYRLAMTDKDGTIEYSNVVSITNKEDQKLGITYIDLSSGTNTATIKVNSKQTQKANISIMDISGKTILNSDVVLQKGISVITKNIPVIPKGIYYIKLFTSDETIVKNTLSRN